MVLVTDLSQLQGLIKRDPAGYREEFLQQQRHFLSRLEVFTLKPPKGEGKEFGELVNFLAQVAPCYPTELAGFPGQVSALLEQHVNALEPPLRRTLVQALMLLRSREMLSPAALLSLFFKLFRCHDKGLRKLLHTHIVSDIKAANRKKSDNELNRTLVNFMYTMLQDPDPTAARKSLEVMVELYRKRVWNDAKTVNVIATAVFSRSTKIVVGALRFFLDVGAPVGDEEDTRDERLAARRADHAYELKKAMKRAKITRQTRKRTKDLKNTKANAARLKLEDAEQARRKPNWPAIELLHDPHGYAKKLLATLRTSNEGFDVRVMMMNLVSRVIASHKVVLLGFYPFMQRYLRPRQEHVTQLLAITAQACHDMVPPDALEPVVRTLADEFVNDRTSDEAAAVGMNTLRAVCERCPLVMSQTLLRDLVEYKKSHNKAVMAAARSLLQFYRENNPDLLRKKDRGKVSAGIKPASFGATVVHDDVEGMEMLRAFKEQAAASKSRGGAVGSDDDDDESEGSDNGSDEEMEDASEEHPGEDAKDAKDGKDEEEESEDEDDEEGEDDEDGEEIEIDSDDLESISGEDEDEDEDDDDDEDSDDEDDAAEDDSDDEKPKKTADKKRKSPEASAKEDEPSKKKRKAEKGAVAADPDAASADSSAAAPDGILSQEDLKLLRALNKKAKDDPAFVRRLMKGKEAQVSESEPEEDSSEDEDDGPHQFLSAEDIASDLKVKRTKEERVALIKKNQEEAKADDRYKIERGRSKKVQARSKPYAMVFGGKKKEFTEKTIMSQSPNAHRPKKDRNFRGRKKKMFGMTTKQHKGRK